MGGELVRRLVLPPLSTRPGTHWRSGWAWRVGRVCARGDDGTRESRDVRLRAARGARDREPRRATAGAGPGRGSVDWNSEVHVRV